MNRNSINVGKKIKTYRKAKKYTLKNLAEKTGLSIGFLSQLERGMTTIAIDSLFNLANVLDVDIMDFFDAAPKSCDDPVVHSYSRPVLSAAPETVQFYLGGAQDHNFQIVPKLLQLMPSQRYLMCPERRQQAASRDFTKTTKRNLCMCWKGSCRWRWTARPTPCIRRTASKSRLASGTAGPTRATAL